jgi:phosphoserine phosphatase
MAPDHSPVLICDLDGTILRGNSFPLWVLYLIVGRFPEFGWHTRTMLSLHVQKLLLRRRLGGIEHARLMRGVQHAWQVAGGDATASAADRVPALLRRQVRPAFEPVLRQIAAGEIDAILATAAAAEYAVRLGHRMGFRHVLATPCRLPPDGTLNNGARKLRRVQELLTDQQWTGRPRVLLTDHLDDLPLMRHCDAVGWFGPAGTMTRALAETRGVKFVDCRWLDAATLPRALVALSAHARSGAGAPHDSTLA